MDNRDLEGLGFTARTKDGREIRLNMTPENDDWIRSARRMKLAEDEQTVTER